MYIGGPLQPCVGDEREEARLEYGWGKEGKCYVQRRREKLKKER